MPGFVQEYRGPMKPMISIKHIRSATAGRFLSAFFFAAVTALAGPMNGPMAGKKDTPVSRREIRRTLMLPGMPGLDSSAAERILPVVFKEARRSRRMRTLELVDCPELAETLPQDTHARRASTLEAAAASGLADELLWVHLLDFNQHEVPWEDEEEKERNLFESILHSLFAPAEARYHVRTVLSIELERVDLATGSTSLEKAAADFTGGGWNASLQSALRILGEEAQTALARLYRHTAPLTTMPGGRVRLDLDDESEAGAGTLFLVRSRSRGNAEGHSRPESGGKPKAVILLEEGGRGATGKVIRQWAPIREDDLAVERPGNAYRHWNLGLRTMPLDPAAQVALEASFGAQPHRRWDFGGALRLGFLEDSRRDYDFFMGLGAPFHLAIHRDPRWTVQGGLSLDADLLFSYDDRGDPANAFILGVFPHARLRYLVAPKADLVLTAGYRFFGNSTGWWTTPEGQNSRPAHWNGEAPKAETGGILFSLGVDFVTF
jgi:hypothetical protein